MEQIYLCKFYADDRHIKTLLPTNLPKKKKEYVLINSSKILGNVEV